MTPEEIKREMKRIYQRAMTPVTMTLTVAEWSYIQGCIRLADGMH
jgi:2-iminoacetate synthase ThiH